MSISRIAWAFAFTVGVALTSAGHAQTVTPIAGGATDPVTGTVQPMRDTQVFAHALLDQFEARIGGGGNGFRWDGQAWIGTDENKVWLKSEGSLLGTGQIEEGKHELLYDRPISTYLDLQAGVRTDWDSATGRTWAALGVQGLAPLFFDYEVTAYLSDRGHAALRVAGYYDLLITQRLILEPVVELNFYSKADPSRSIGAGLSTIDAGLRLRYEVSRKFAPYIGVAYDGKFGQTAEMARRAGDSAGAVQFVVGIRSWF